MAICSGEKSDQESQPHGSGGKNSRVGGGFESAAESQNVKGAYSGNSVGPVSATTSREDRNATIQNDSDGHQQLPYQFVEGASATNSSLRGHPFIRDILFARPMYEQNQQREQNTLITTIQEEEDARYARMLQDEELSMRYTNISKGHMTEKEKVNRARSQEETNGRFVQTPPPPHDYRLRMAEASPPPGPGSIIPDAGNENDRRGEVPHGTRPFEASRFDPQEASLSDVATTTTNDSSLASSMIPGAVWVGGNRQDESEMGTIQIGESVSTPTQNRRFRQELPPLLEAHLASTENDESASPSTVEEGGQEQSGEPLQQQQEEVSREGQSSVPLAHASRMKESDLITPAKRRRMRIIIGLLILFICALVASVVSSVVLLRNKDETKKTKIIWRFKELTIVIQLDENPEQTGWELNCGNSKDDGIEFPPGSYESQYNELIIYSDTLKSTNDVCTFTIVDTGGDGIDNGYFEVYQGTNITDMSSFLVGGSEFTDSATVSFQIVVPSSSPTDIQSEEPTSSPTSLCGNGIVDNLEFCDGEGCNDDCSGCVEEYALIGDTCVFQTPTPTESFSEAPTPTPTKPPVAITSSPTPSPSKRPTPAPVTPEPTHNPTPKPTMRQTPTPCVPCEWGSWSAYR